MFEREGIAKSLWVIAAALAVALVATARPGAEDRSFKPLRGKFYTVWNTERDLVDIEIVGSTSLIPGRHRLEPERVLRFRLEKAYVGALLAEQEPGYEIVRFEFDVDTGLPRSFLQAVSRKGPSHRDIPGVPILSEIKQLQGVLSIGIHSDWSTEPLERMSRTMVKCRGRQLESGLFENDPAGGDACLVADYPTRTRYLAPYDGDLSLIVTCEDMAWPSIDCGLRFPYCGFAVELRFNHARLPKWRESVNRAIDFLKSKEYR
jgi:hypothetical protein